ncbi:MAG: beta-ketoacyl-ACP synthase [Deltaproteobacteria bacterium]|nr:beta-ketoacyl-ACP synthase [Deltaproteobacteria bacterium]MBK8713375.1 beta-ketoacyl-ACP synthase [Deltaproteobacteria bacterium]
MSAPRRVVVTGMGVASPIGHDRATVVAALREARGGIVSKPEWGAYKGLWTRLAGEVVGLSFDYPRKATRTMGRVALLAVWATEQALADAGLEPESLAGMRVGISHGSTHGSSSSMKGPLERVFTQQTFEGMPSSAYFRFMSHTTAANLAIHFGVRGRVITTCSACTSGSQGIGYGYEAIKYGHEDLMLCGGAEELHELHAAVFDVMYATSTKYNDRPELSPRPYDAARDGMVIGEGAGTLVLEEYEHAVRRGARIHAELVGWGTNCDGMHATSPSVDGMAGAIQRALQDAGLSPDAIDYVNGHGTATELGDIAETHATAQVLGTAMPISSTKSYTGHTLGACGAIEAYVSIVAMQDGFMPPTRNLDEVDPRCAVLDYVRTTREAQLERVMSNNFAFGGINTSLVFARPR